MTLWQAWCEGDREATRVDNAAYPSAEALRQAIRAAVEGRRAEIDRRKSQTTTTGLKRVK